MVFFDLKMGPILLNKYEKIFLLILILNIKPTMKKKINYYGLKKIINSFYHML